MSFKDYILKVTLCNGQNDRSILLEPPQHPKVAEWPKQTSRPKRFQLMPFLFEAIFFTNNSTLWLPQQGDAHTCNRLRKGAYKPVQGRPNLNIWQAFLVAHKWMMTGSESSFKSDFARLPTWLPSRTNVTLVMSVCDHETGKWSNIRSTPRWDL